MGESSATHPHKGSSYTQKHRNMITSHITRILITLIILIKMADLPLVLVPVSILLPAQPSA